MKKALCIFLALAFVLCVIFFVGCEEEEFSSLGSNADQNQEQELSKWGIKLTNLGIYSESNEKILLETLPNIIKLDKTDGAHVFLAGTKTDEVFEEYYVIVNSNKDIVQIETIEYYSEFRTIIYPKYQEPNLDTVNIISMAENWFLEEGANQEQYLNKYFYFTNNISLEWLAHPYFNNIYLCPISEGVSITFLQVEFINGCDKEIDLNWNDYILSGKIVKYTSDGISIKVCEATLIN